MKHFIEKHSALIDGVLVMFDRVILHGHLPIAGAPNLVAWAVREKICLGSLAKRGAEYRLRLKTYAQACAQRARRPFIHCGARVRKESLVSRVIQEHTIRSGLVCVLEAQEMCPAIVFDGREQAPRVRDRSRMCQVFYFYLLDPEFGLIHVRIQGWYPFDVQVYVNGHSWLDRQLRHARIRCTRIDNTFLHVADFAKAQQIADSFATLDWSTQLNRWASRFNPLLKDAFSDLRYSWFIEQVEVATDVLFKPSAPFAALYHRLLRYAILAFGAREVMSFLGKKLPDGYTGEVVGDLRRRYQGWRVKFWVRSNAIKFYDKLNRLLRIETVFNCLSDFHVRRAVYSPKTKTTTVRFAPMRKAVEFLPHVLAIARRANARMLDALAAIDLPERVGPWLLAVTRPAPLTSTRRVRALNVLATPDIQLFRAVMQGSAQLRGLSNADVRRALWTSSPSTTAEQRSRSARVSRHFARLRAHGLITKIPHTHRWRPTNRGLAVMAKAIDIRDALCPLAPAA